MTQPRSKMHERLLDASAARELARRRHVVEEGGERIVLSKAELKREAAREARARMSPEELEARAEKHRRMASSLHRARPRDGTVDTSAQRAVIAQSMAKRAELDAASPVPRRAIVSAKFAERMKRAGVELPKGITVVDPLLHTTAPARKRKR